MGEIAAEMKCLRQAKYSFFWDMACHDQSIVKVHFPAHDLLEQSKYPLEIDKALFRAALGLL